MTSHSRDDAAEAGPPARYTRRQFLQRAAAWGALPFWLSACGSPLDGGSTALPSPTTALPPPSATATPDARPAFYSGVYRNLFAEQGYPAAEIAARIDAAWQSLFASTDDQRRVYYPAGTNDQGPLAYIKDIGNNDIRTEGMSYGMMIAVQLNKKAEFDAIWNWAKTYMQHQDGDWKGYFSWHNQEDGQPLDPNPASDGEEWFVTALFFAAGRWGNGSGIYDYQAEADALLNTMLHKTDQISAGSAVTNMFDRTAQQVVFVPMGAAALYTDPSYHLPAFYELWGRWAAGTAGQAQADRAFWLAAARTSRAFFQRASHPTTGLTPDYAHFDGTPQAVNGPDAFRFDAFRTISNIALDYAWFGADEQETQLCDRLQAFFAGQPGYVNQYTLAGQPLSTDRSPGLIAMNAVAGLAATNRERAARFVAALWELAPPTGKWRYYDGLLYLLALLQVSGNFRLYAPGH